MSGVGAAGMAIAKILMASGVPNIVGVDRTGTLYEGRPGMNDAKQWFAQHTNPDRRQGTLRDVLRGADVFVGVSGPGLLTRDDVATMEKGSMVFALANPDPEILPDEAAGIVSVMATGRSDYPNQINNVLCFPGMFRGALDAGATEINEHMKLVAAEAIAACVDEDDLSAEHVVPSVFDKRVAERVARSVAEAAREDGVVRA
jgi:malate dehydrogenase (oxaloacetate-decarboxylating)